MGRSEMPTSCPKGFSRGEASTDGDAPREKGCRIRSGPFGKMLPMKRRKTMNGGIVRDRLFVLSFRLLSVPSCCPCSASRLPKFVAITLLQHPLDIRGAVENLAAQLDVGNPSLIAVILQTPAADLQPLRKLLVRIETLAVQRGFALRKQRLNALERRSSAWKYERIRSSCSVINSLPIFRLFDARSSPTPPRVSRSGFHCLYSVSALLIVSAPCLQHRKERPHIF